MCWAWKDSEADSKAEKRDQHMQERSLGMKDEGMSRENCKPGHVTLPLKAPQGLPYHLRVKAEVLTMTQEALSDLT